MSIPNIVYKSLDVRYTVFSTIANFVSEMTLGQVVTLPSGQVVTNCGADSSHSWGESCNLRYKHHSWHVSFL